MGLLCCFDQLRITILRPKIVLQCTLAVLHRTWNTPDLKHAVEIECERTPGEGLWVVVTLASLFHELALLRGATLPSLFHLFSPFEEWLAPDRSRKVGGRPFSRDVGKLSHCSRFVRPAFSQNGVCYSYSLRWQMKQVSFLTSQLFSPLPTSSHSVETSMSCALKGQLYGGDREAPRALSSALLAANTCKCTLAHLFDSLSISALS